MAENSSHNSDRTEMFDDIVALNNLINRICGVRETNHIMDLVISELIRLTDSDHGVVSLISSLEHNKLTTVIRSLDQTKKEPSLRTDDLYIGWVLKNKKMLRIDDICADERFARPSIENPTYKAVVCNPMIVRGEIIGIVTLLRSVKKPPYSDKDCRLIGIIASQSGQILANSKLLEDLTRANELLEISLKRLKEENYKLKVFQRDNFAFENIVGKSVPMKRVLGLISKFCANDSPVLIIGETGTGKDLVARAIHFNSQRKEKPFVIVNCGTYTMSLLESELFGHVKGAFTGANRNKIGLFQEANGGTIFLDEIGDAPLEIQVAILRVIQSGEIRQVGSTKTEVVNVRVISATNKDLKKAIATKAFREDLFYRLGTFVIELPSLRERRNDISLLVDYFLKKIKIKIGREQLEISPPVMDIIMNYPWPGNIRELENELERMAVISGYDGAIEVKDLSPKLLAFAANQNEDTAEGRGLLKDAVSKLEHEMIISTLAGNKGNILQSSKALGLTRKGLMDKMQRYGIQIDYKKLLAEH